MNALRIVIADDEDLARSVVREYLKDSIDIEIVAECRNGFEAVKAVSELKPDLLLLDIQMPRLDGFEVLELIERETNVIFTTAYDQYAIKAFDVHAIDYLLKPFSAERLAEALDRARKKIDRGEPTATAAMAADARPPGTRPDRILIRDGSDVHVVPMARIDYVEAQDDYVCFRAEGKRYLKQQTLADVETILEPARFVRIHRSYILNVDRLAKLELYAKDSHAAILRDGTRLPVSRSGYARLNSLIG
ncbi:MAG TPA: response regulator [Terriglobia bacterium]|nr:response regulator [Terriglobia bacterium]